MITAFITGLLGSLHCLGMCGPIALAIPVGKSAQLMNAFLYNGGRIFAYFLLGLLFGSIGHTLTFFGWQRGLSIGTGILVIIMAVFPVVINRMEKGFFFIHKIKSKIAFLLQQREQKVLPFLGFFNGLLPCGLVYFGLAGAIAQGNVFSGGFYMLLFGLGTLPMMATVFYLKDKALPNFRVSAKRLIPVLMFCFGLLLILRGMNLGIPYLSPELKSANHSEVRCH